MELNYILTITEVRPDDLRADDIRVVILSNGDTNAVAVEVTTPGNVPPNQPDARPAPPLRRDTDLANHVVGRLYQEAPQLIRPGACFYIRVDLAKRETEVQQVAKNADIAEGEIITEHEHDHDGGINSAHLSVH